MEVVPEIPPSPLHHTVELYSLQDVEPPFIKSDSQTSRGTGPKDVSSLERPPSPPQLSIQLYALPDVFLSDNSQSDVIRDPASNSHSFPDPQQLSISLFPLPDVDHSKHTSEMINTHLAEQDPLPVSHFIDLFTTKELPDEQLLPEPSPLPESKPQARSSPATFPYLVQGVDSHAGDPLLPLGADERNPTQTLLDNSATSCLYNSADRIDPPKCAPETREQILLQIEKWILEDNNGSAALMWLFGAAGAGKSAIAQTTVENSVAKGLHAASFFFSRSGNTEQSEARRLLPTIISQVLDLFPSVRPEVEKAILMTPHLFDMTLKNQMEHLLIHPMQSQSNMLSALQSPKARLVIIDGLDECNDIEQQKEILQMLAEALPLLAYPFRFLIVSRPEDHIIDMFHNHPAFENISFDELDLSLDVTADKSVEKYLRQSFERIRLEHRMAQGLGPEWPSQEAIDNIVAKASGKFIYASTVIKYVGHPDFFPHKRLQFILDLAH